MNKFVVILCCLVVAVAGGAASVHAADWSAVFNPDGTVRDLQGGIDAVFLEDKVSDNLGLDMSVRFPAFKPTVANGAVMREHDLGNGYVFAKKDDSGNLQIYTGVERFNSTADTYVEFEFYQDPVGVKTGVPWPIYGDRRANDVLVRVDFVGGQISSAAFKRWDGSAYQTIVTVAADGGNECRGANYQACAGSPPMPPLLDETWDAAGVPVTIAQPDAFVEIGFNVSVLLGSNVEFSSLQVKTPQDIILDGFRHLGWWASRAKL